MDSRGESRRPGEEGGQEDRSRPCPPSFARGRLDFGQNPSQKRNAQRHPSIASSPPAAKVARLDPPPRQSVPRPPRHRRRWAASVSGLFPHSPWSRLVVLPSACARRALPQCCPPQTMSPNSAKDAAPARVRVLLRWVTAGHAKVSPAGSNAEQARRCRCPSEDFCALSHDAQRPRPAQLLFCFFNNNSCLLLHCLNCCQTPWSTCAAPSTRFSKPTTSSVAGSLASLARRELTTLCRSRSGKWAG